MPAALRLMLCVPVVAVLAWASICAIDVIRADDLAREASREMSAWAAAGTEPARETVASVREKLAAGLAIRAVDPSAHELLGMLETGDAGIRHLVRALELRPVSPYTWANLLEARYVRGDSGAALEPLIAIASQLGPAEPGVQRVIADYGSALWNELTPAGQARVDVMITSGMRRNPLEMLRISDRRGRLEAACRHVVGLPQQDRRVSRYCERWEITP